MKNIIFHLICALSFSQVIAQHNDVNSLLEKTESDTVSCGEYTLIINVPRISLKHKSFFQYEEGFFVTYPYIDSAYLFIHDGHNMTRPFCDTSLIKMISENDTLKCYYGTCGNYSTKEVYYKKEKLTISYVNIKREDLPLFDNVISSLKIYSIKADN